MKREKSRLPGSNSRPNVSEGYEVPLSYRGDRFVPLINRHCFPHIQRMPTRKKILYTVANPARGLLSREMYTIVVDRASTIPSNIRGCQSGTWSQRGCCIFTLIDRASSIPSNIRGCRSGTWLQRGTKVNGSHHGDNPLLRPTGIQIATKNYATLQAMALANNKTVHQTSFKEKSEHT